MNIPEKGDSGANGANQDGKTGRPAWCFGGGSEPPGWLVRAQPFLARLGGGDARIGAGLAAVLIATALMYSRSLGNGFVMDDHWVIVDDRYIGNWSFLWKSLVNDEVWFRDPLNLPQSSYYRPLSDLWWAINFHLFGLHPAGWHATQIILHLIAVVLVFRLAARLAGDRWTGLLAAALFALMPRNAEAVAGSYAINSPLSTVFLLGAFECHLRAALTPSHAEGPRAGPRSGPVHAPPGARRYWVGVSLVFYGGALMSYETAVAFPALVAAHAFLLGSIRDNRRFTGFESRLQRAAAAMWPYALEAGAYLALRSWVVGAGRPAFSFSQAGMAHVGLALISAALNVPRVLVTFLAMIAIPSRVGMSHFLRLDSDAAWDPRRPMFYLLAVALGAFCCAAFLLLRRHPRRRLYLFCAAWFLIALGPVLGLLVFWLDPVIGDRYLYLPSIGLWIMAADLARNFASGGQSRFRVVLAGAAVALFLYSAALFSVLRFWHDDVAAFSRAVQETPSDPYFRAQLGFALERRGNLVRARQELTAAASLARQNDPIVLYELSQVDERLNDRPAAARAMAQWIARLGKLAPGQFAELAFADDAAGDPKGAEAALAKAAGLPGGAAIAALAEAQIRFRHGDRAGAEKALLELLGRYPNDAQALDVLGAVRLSGRNYAGALEAYRRAAQAAPRAAALHYKIALTLHQMGREREARDECAIALAGRPDDPKVQALMATIERSGGPR